MVAGIFLNSVVIISLWRSTQLRKKICYFTIFLLSCFDLAVVAIIHPVLIWWTIVHFLDNHKELHHALSLFLSMLFHGHSVLALLTLNLERYLALNYPFFHHKSVTKRRVLLFLAVICFFDTILTALTFKNLVINYHVVVLIKMSNFVLIFVLLTFKILNVAVTKARYAVPDTENTSEVGTKFQGGSILKKFSTCYLAVLFCFICYIPVIIYCSVCVGYWHPKGQNCDKKYEQWLSTIFSMNSTFNCLIFFWRNSALRHEGMKVIKRCWTL